MWLLRFIIAGPLIPLCVMSMFPCSSFFVFLFILYVIFVLFIVVPAILFNFGSFIFKLVSPGFIGVIVCFSFLLIWYPSPVLPVFGYVIPPVASIIFSVFIVFLFVCIVKWFGFSFISVTFVFSWICMFSFFSIFSNVFFMVVL